MKYHDHHFHPVDYALMLGGLRLDAASSLEGVLGMLADRASRVDGALIGHRFNEESFADARLPSASDIDSVVSDRPVLIFRQCGHIAVANSAALAVAGIDDTTSDPESGSFDRDRRGHPTGVLRENAIRSVAEAVEPLAAHPSDEDILEALAGLPTMGIGSITGIVSAGSGLTGGHDEVDLLVRLAPRLPIEIDVLVICQQPSELAGAALRLGRAEGSVRFHGWKDFSDGSLGGHTAALHQPYADQPDNRGMITLEQGRAIEMGQASLDLGGMVAIHAIGDRANDLVLDIMSDLISGGADPARLRVEHASLLSDRAIHRFADLQVTASVQPAFIDSDAPWIEKRLGEDRLAMAYPFRSLVEAGVTVIGGSDAPVEHPDPAPAISSATDRPDLNPEQRLTREQAERLFEPVLR
jgi:predicted amidohydrolase YtcJ